MKRIIQNIIRIIQKVLIIPSLFVIYIFGMGITLIFVAVFNRRLLKEKDGKKNTFWKDAKGYGADMNDSLRQA